MCADLRFEEWDVLHLLPISLACWCQRGSQSSAQSQSPWTNATVCGCSRSACIRSAHELRGRMMGNLCIHANKQEHRGEREAVMKLCRLIEVWKQK